MPRANESYVPREGALVELNERFYPRGVSRVECVEAAMGHVLDMRNPDSVSITLRGSDDIAMRDTLANWRYFGLRPAYGATLEDNPPAEPSVPPVPEPGSQFTLNDDSMYGAGPFTVDGTAPSDMWGSGNIGRYIIRFSALRTRLAVTRSNRHGAYWQDLISHGYHEYTEDTEVPISRIRPDDRPRRAGERETELPYQPQLGDRVRLSDLYNPEGVSVVILVDGEGEEARVRLRGENRTQMFPEVTETLEDWRIYGIRLVERYTPAVGDIVEMGSGYVPEGPQRVVEVSSGLAGGSVTIEDVRYGARNRFAITSSQLWGMHLAPGLNPDSGPYMPAVGDVVVLNSRSTSSLNYGRGPWTVATVRDCTRCSESREADNRTLVELRDADGRSHEYHLNRWRERGIALQSPASGGRETEVPALEIPEGTRYPVDVNRAEDLMYQYDRAVYGAGAYSWGLLRIAQDHARQNGDGLVHLENGMCLHVGNTRTYRWEYTLIDTEGVYATGYDADGYDPDGFNADGYNEAGYDEDGYDEDGFNADGFNEDGYDSEGFNEDGYNEDGYDRYGDSRYDDEPGGVLRPWDYRPSLNFRNLDDDPQPECFYGVEIELTSSCTREEMELIREYGRDDALFFPKSDGSVAGYELNVHPMTWAWASAEFPWEFVEKVADAGSSVRESDNGIHVHVSRKGFSGEAHLYRWMKFVYRNQAHAERIAGRSTDQWAGFRESHKSSQKNHALNQMRMRKAEERRRAGDDYYPRNGYVSDSTSDNRYSAINTTNRDTVEVRIFASTVDPKVFRARVGFVAATVEYTRQLTSRAIIAGGWDWSAFQAWLLDNRETYPDLAAVEEAQLEQAKAAEKSQVQGAERRRLRSEWLNADALMSFAEFLQRHEAQGADPEQVADAAAGAE